MDGGNHFDAATRAIQQKKPVSEIDFSLHTMEDGTQVSTQERVCKGTAEVLAIEQSADEVFTIQRCKHRRFFHLLKTNSSPHMTVTSPIYNSSNSISIARVV